tara:strand:- start:379920 stop:381314 length:1395 start_codon:yes stop_codon:yes gene_type:complete
MNRPPPTTDASAADESEPAIRAKLIESPPVPGRDPLDEKPSAAMAASTRQDRSTASQRVVESDQHVVESDRSVLSQAASESIVKDTTIANDNRSFRRRWFDRVARFGVGAFRVASLIVLLAFLAAIPVVQLISLGYLVDVSGRLAGGAKLRESVRNLDRAGTIGLAVLAVIIAALPSQLLAHWEFVAQTIDPGSNQASILRAAAITLSLLAMVYLMWAWIRGGKLRDYLWPQPIRFIREAWRPSTWNGAADRVWDFTAALELPRLFWLGLRCAAGTLVWLIPAILIITLTRNGKNGLAGFAAAVSLFALGITLLYLPMLQANFASRNRLSALFDVRTIRRDFRRAPWAWLGAMIVALVLTPIPLYLLKIEATPREVVWLPCLLFVTFMLPARIATGMALRRARNKPEPSGRWAAISRWSVRAVMPLVVGVYLLFLYVSQYTSWDGLQTWIQQHAILVPMPFYGI